jgi:hypothetical protein
MATVFVAPLRHGRRNHLPKRPRRLAGGRFRAGTRSPESRFPAPLPGRDAFRAGFPGAAQTCPRLISVNPPAWGPVPRGQARLTNTRLGTFHLASLSTCTRSRKTSPVPSTPPFLRGVQTFPAALMTATRQGVFVWARRTLPEHFGTSLGRISVRTIGSAIPFTIGSFVSIVVPSFLSVKPMEPWVGLTHRPQKVGATLGSIHLHCHTATVTIELAVLAVSPRGHARIAQANGQKTPRCHCQHYSVGGRPGSVPPGTPPPTAL